MKSKHTYILSLLFILFITKSSIAQVSKDEDYANDNFMRYEDWIYKPNIKTVLLHESKWELSPALIQLGSEQTLELSFDDLDGDLKTYSYTLIHCDAAWQPTDIMVSEYLSGFFDDNITNFQYAVNTLQNYTHYKIVFPNNSIKITKSGNYIVKVYQDGEKDNVVLTKRFMVFTDKVTVAGYMHQAASADNYFNKQELDFSILYSSYNITNPFADLKVVITQNNRWDNAAYNIKPIFTREKELTFDYDDGTNAFEGGNEFRPFDTRDLRTITQYVNRSYIDSNKTNQVELIYDKDLSLKRFVSYNDNNGKFLIRKNTASNSENEADYAWVNFFLPYDAPAADGNFYIMGALTNWRTNKENKMTYNYTKKGYECKLFLKQGYYDYHYVFLRDGDTKADETLIEGTHWETENDYTVYVYHRQFGTYYDQLIGMKKFNSIKK